ncbi:unnamed protein product [Prorocentrum cordatum]|uniref:Nickel/cobalt efflux system n=1 Tax=Prorocentrum cordatum TaxID=2364126 RepID=A0ABN9VM67_9DINO|nr:unnamed protein product [Polarella glacialis]
MAVTGACWYRGQHFARASAAGLAAAHVRNEPCATQLCFSCGMCLVDTGNGLLMLATYNWAKVRPSEKIFYNFLVTSMSATIALCIGTLELLQVICRAVGLHGPFWESVSSIDMAAIGYGIIVAFLVIFAAAVCFSCTRREELWAPIATRRQHEPVLQLSQSMSASSATSCATFQGALVFSVGQDIPAAP